MINRRCKIDHFSYANNLPIKKNSSAYTAAYKELNVNDIIEDRKAETFKKSIAPPNLNSHLLKRSLHESSLHYSPNKSIQLPSLKIGSTYKDSYLEKGESESIVRGK